MAIIIYRNLYIVSILCVFCIFVDGNGPNINGMLKLIELNAGYKLNMKIAVAVAATATTTATATAAVAAAIKYL